eukprot:56319_1
MSTIKTKTIPKTLVKEDARIILLGECEVCVDVIVDKTQFNTTSIEFEDLELEPLHTTNTFLIAMYDGTSEILSEEASNLRQLGYKFMTSTPDIIGYLGDKVNLQRNTDESLRKYLPVEYDLSSPQFPCFLKKRSGEGADTVHLLQNQQDYNSIMKKIKSPKDWLLQEAIPGDEYSVLLVVVNGKIVANATKRMTMEKLTKQKEQIFVRGADETVNLRTQNSNVSTNVFTIFGKFLTDYNGFVDIDFKLLNGEPIIFEFNTRLSGHIFDAKAADLKYLLTQYILNSY